MLRDATFDVADRLLHFRTTVSRHAADVMRSCRVKGTCRHRRRLLPGEGPVFLSLSTHHREGGLALPYLWIQGRPALVCQVASMFAP